MHCGDQRHAGLCLGRRPCTSRRWVQGRSQGTTLSASDLHNTRATILNPFYNMEYKIIKKIRQNTAWIEADILGKNLIPNWCSALAPAIVYVSNDVTIPFKAVTSQWQHKERCCEHTRIRPKSFWNLRIGARTCLYFLCTRANTLMLDSVYIKGNQMNFFSKMWRISWPRISQNNDLHVN